MFTAWAMYDTLLRLREAEEALSRARAKLDAAGRAA